MSASNRWWRDYETECAEWDAAFRHVSDPQSIRALTEDGIEVRVRLYTTQPMYFGTIEIDEEAREQCMDCGAEVLGAHGCTMPYDD